MFCRGQVIGLTLLCLGVGLLLGWLLGLCLPVWPAAVALIAAGFLLLRI